MANYNLELTFDPSLTAKELCELRNSIEGLYRAYMCNEPRETDFYVELVESNTERLAQRLAAIETTLVSLGKPEPTYKGAVTDLIVAAKDLAARTQGRGYQFAEVEATAQKISTCLAALAEEFD